MPAPKKPAANKPKPSTRKTAAEDSLIRAQYMAVARDWIAKENDLGSDIQTTIRDLDSPELKPFIRTMAVAGVRHLSIAMQKHLMDRPYTPERLRDYLSRYATFEHEARVTDHLLSRFLNEPNATELAIVVEARLAVEKALDDLPVVAKGFEELLCNGLPLEEALDRLEGWTANWGLGHLAALKEVASKVSCLRDAMPANNTTLLSSAEKRPNAVRVEYVERESFEGVDDLREVWERVFEIALALTQGQGSPAPATPEKLSELLAYIRTLHNKVLDTQRLAKRLSSVNDTEEAAFLQAYEVLDHALRQYPSVDRSRSHASVRQWCGSNAEPFWSCFRRLQFLHERRTAATRNVATSATDTVTTNNVTVSSPTMSRKRLRGLLKSKGYSADAARQRIHRALEEGELKSFDKGESFDEADTYRWLESLPDYTPRKPPTVTDP